MIPTDSKTQNVQSEVHKPSLFMTDPSNTAAQSGLHLPYQVDNERTSTLSVLTRMGHGQTKEELEMINKGHSPPDISPATPSSSMPYGGYT